MKKKLLIIFIILIPVRIFLYKEIAYQTKTVVDTPKNFMKHLHEEVKNDIAKRIPSQRQFL